MKRHKWGSCNSNDTQKGQWPMAKNSNDIQKGTNEWEAVIRMTHNTIAK